MLYVATTEYGVDQDRLRGTHAARRTYLQSFIGNGQLRAAGPFAEDAGALCVLDADTVDAAEEIVRRDPLAAAGVITSWTVCLLAHWSAQEARGAR